MSSLPSTGRGSTFFLATSWSDAATPRHVRTLADELARRGHRVLLLVDHRRHDAEEHLGNPAIWTWPSERPTHLRDALFLRRLMRRHRPACVVANFGAVNLMMVVGAISRVPARVSWYRTIEYQNDLDSRPSPVRMLKKWRKRLVYGMATRVIAVSEAARRDAQRSFGVAARKAVTFPNAIADPLETDPGLATQPRDPHRLVCVGRLHPSKGQDVVLRALARLQGEGAALEVAFIGQGPAHDAYLSLARELGVLERCAFLGKVAHDGVFPQMAAALATIVPSREEAFGMVSIESMAVGTPVVASRVGGLADIIRHGVDGMLVPPDDPEALAGALHSLYTRPELRAAMGAEARRRFLERYEQRRAITMQADWLESLARRDD